MTSDEVNDTTVDHDSHCPMHLASISEDHRKEIFSEPISKRNTIEHPKPCIAREEEKNNRVCCDACPFCSDTCENPDCFSCEEKRDKIQTILKERQNQNKFLFPFGRKADTCTIAPSLTMCQIRRHNHAKSAWLLVGKSVYDATSFVPNHPGGQRSILRKSGGVADCTVDLNFHSKSAARAWKQEKIGNLVSCPGEIVALDDEQLRSNFFSCANSDPCFIS